LLCISVAESTMPTDFALSYH